MGFRVSVIIPVYNQGEFLVDSINTVIIQQEVSEIILVEDGSTDDSYSICQKIQYMDVRIKLLRHPNGINRGAAASRNLGILKATCEYIAFLDADDWYLPDRFRIDKTVFESNPSVNVVYNSSQIKSGDFYLDFGYGFDVRKESKRRGYSSVYQFILDFDITLVDTNSITFRKCLFSDVKLFDERLSLHQDTEFWLRIFRSNDVLPSEVSRPVSIARRHSRNRITKKNRVDAFRLDYVWIDNIGISYLHEFEKKYLVQHFSRTISNPIRPHLLRKFIFHGVRITLNMTQNFFVKIYYNWCSKRFKL